MANTYKLKYTAQEIDEILERADKEPLVLYYDKSASLYRGFSSKENKELWISDPVVNADLELFNFVAPAPFTMTITPKNSKNQYILEGETGNYIEFSFATKDENGTVKSESVDVTFNFDDLRGNTQSVTQTYNSSEDVKFNVDKYLKDGENVVTVLVEGRLTNAYNSDDWKFTQISLELTSSFNVALPRTSGEGIAVPFKVVGPSSSIIEFIIDGDQENSVKYTTTYSTEETRQELQNNLIAGKHTLQIRASVLLNGTTFYSNILYFEFVIKGSTDTFITLAQTFDRTSPIVTEDRANLKIYSEQYVKTEIPWGYYSGTIDRADIVWKLGDEVISTISTSNSSEQTNYSPDPIKFIPTTAGDYVLSAYTGTTLLESYNVKVIGNTNGVEEAKNFLNLKLSALGRNNEETNPGTWTYSNYTTNFTGFSWSTNQGWSNDALQVSGGAQAVINYKPLSYAAHTNGATIEVEFEVKNVNDSNAVLLNMMSDSGVGIKITADKAIIKSTQGSELSTQFIPNEKIKLAFIIFSTGSSESPRMLYIMNNGVYERGLQYAATDTFTSDSNIIIGDPNGNATIRLYSIKCYTRALTKNEEFYNFIIDSGNIAEKIIENDILEDGTPNVSVSKMQGIIPTMLFTGDIDSLLAANDKETQRYINVEFINPYDKSKNFKITHARMKLQGTSSLGYPRKNFKMYSGAKHDAVMYDFEGNVLEDGLYAFADGDVPVHTWTLKADFSDSSCTHNASVARLFGDIEPLVMVNSERVLMTPPQKVAAEYKESSGVDFPYQIRTTPNALAMVAFYRQTESDDYIFMGQYTMLNDKGNDEVYGFKSIYNNGLDPYYFNGTKDKTKILWNNSKTHCFEVLDNTNIYSTFSSTDGFWDTYTDESGITHQMWEKAFESRYPEIEDDDTVQTRQSTATSLYNFIEWMKTTIGDQSKFESECEQHLDLYKCASYYVYLIRFGAVDQVQKNMMWTTFDDQIWFPIRYDNDTILGLANTGNIAYDYTIFRNTIDPDSSNGSSYCYAGHDSWLWNALEASTKFMNTVRIVDGALYEAGLTYTNVCHYFDDLAADQWCERIYNDNQEYKYIDPLLVDGKDWMKFMQGKRKSHRHWWLKNRFDLCDALYVTGEYVNRSIRLIAQGTPSGSEMRFKAAKSTNFGWGINKVPLENNVAVDIETNPNFAFNTNKLGRTLAKGDPVYIYCSNNIEEADFSELAQYLSSVVDISGTYDTELGTNLRVLKIGVPESLLNAGVLNKASDLTFSGFNTATRLEYLDVRGLSKVINLPFMSYLSSIKTLLAKGTGLTDFTCAEGVVFDKLELPGTIETLTLSKCGWTELDYTPTNLNHIVFQGMGNKEEVKNFFVSWANYLLSDQNTNWTNKTAYIDGIDWENVDADLLLNLREKMGDNLELRGTIGVKSYRAELISGGGLENDQVRKFTLLFGEDIFNKAASPNLYITAPDSVYFYPEKYEILEGESVKLYATVFSTTGDTEGILRFLVKGTEEGSYNRHEASFADSSVGLLSTIETGEEDDLNFQISAVFSPSNGGQPSSSTVTINILKRIYVSSIVISGTDNELLPSGSHTFTCTTTPEYSTITGKYASKVWELTGDAVTCGALVLSSQDATSCTIISDATKTIDEVTATLTVKYTEESGDIVSKSKTLFVRNDKIAISKSTNPYLLKVFRDHGLCSNEDYMTKQECAAVFSEDIQPTGARTDQSIFYGASNLNLITNFDEFQYFTNITEINEYAFTLLTGLKKITLPSGIVSIKEGAFAGLANLESINIPPLVSTIGPIAFFGCGRLKSLTIPSFVTSIDYTSFSDSGITTLGTANTNVISEVGWKENNQLKFVLSTFAGDFEIPSSITSIYKYCFSKCNNLRKLTIPNVNILPDSKYFGLCEATLSGDDIVNNIGWKSGTKLIGILPVVEDITIPEGIVTLGTESIGRGIQLSISMNSQTKNGHPYKYYQTSESNRYSHKKLTLSASVRVIETNAASNNNALTSVTLNSGLTTIGDSAFSTCSSIRSITIPSTVTYIGKTAFSNCTGISSITFTAGGTELEIGSQAFYNTSISTVTIPSTVSTIPSGCFGSCKVLSTVNMPSTITKIESGAFSNCVVLNNVVIPDSVSTIGEVVFSGCSALSAITLNSELSSIGYDCFRNCIKLTSINIPNTTTIDYGVFRGCTTLVTVNIPTCMSVIPSSTFYGCSALSTINIPSGITTLNSSCFYGCENLGTIELPQNITEIKESAFENCKQLRSINLPNTITSLSERVFYNCSSLTTISIPTKLTKLSSYLLYGCSQLQTITLGDELTAINEGCFEGCSNLTYVVIPKKVVSLGNRAFFGCSSIRYIKINDSISSIGTNCFSGCLNLGNIFSYSYTPPTLGTTVWGSGTEMTGSTSGSKYLYIPSKSKTKYSTSWSSLISTNGFSVVEGFVEEDDIFITPTRNTVFTGETVNFVAGKINQKSTDIFKFKLFSGNTECSLTSESKYWYGGTESDPILTLTQTGALVVNSVSLTGDITLTILAYNTADEEENISKNITISTTALSTTDSKKVITKTANPEVMSICYAEGWSMSSDYMYEYECKEITKIGTAFSKSTITSFNEFQYFTSIRFLTSNAFLNCEQLTSITLPEGITEIGNNCFQNCYNIANITIPSTVVKLYNYCFSGNTSLTTISFPQGLTSIGNRCFYNCTKLTNVTLPNTLTTLGEASFSMCKALTSITIPGSVELIGNSAFDGCSVMKTLTIQDGVKYIGANAFNNCSRLSSASLPDSLVEIRENAFYFCSEMAGQLIFSTTLKKILSNAFYYCNSITKVVAPGIEELGSSAFRQCGKLTYVELSDNITTLSGCFNRCINLQEIKVPKYLKTLGSYTFTWCVALNSIELPDTVESLGESCFESCSKLTSINLGDGITKLGSRCFFRCTGLEKIKVPDCITSLPSRCFYGCSELREITLPVNLKSIAEECFCGCEKVTDLYVKNINSLNISDAGKSAFDIRVQNLNTENEIEAIEEKIDTEHITFTSTTSRIWEFVDGEFMPDNTTTQGTTAEVSIKITSDIDCYFSFTWGGTFIDQDIFYIYFDNKPYNWVITNNDRYFSTGGTLSISDYVQAIPISAGSHTVKFNYYRGYTSGARTLSVKNMKLSESATWDNISGSFAKNDVSKILHCIEGYESIYNSTENLLGFIADVCEFNITNADNWYEKNNNLVITTTPNVNSLSSGDYVDFDICNLESVSETFTYELYKDSVLCSHDSEKYWIGEEDNPDVVLNLKLGTITVSEENEFEYYNITVKAIGNTSAKTITKALTVSGFNDTIIASSSTNNELVTICKNKGWCQKDGINLWKSDCSCITSIETTFKQSSITSFTELQYFTKLTDIPSGAFSGCSGLSDIVLPENIITIEDHAFSDCTSLIGSSTGFVVPDKVTSIGISAFENTGITSIELPETLKTIDNSCFNGCTELKEITSMSRIAPETKAGTFNSVGSNVSEGKTLIVPVSSYGYDKNYWNTLNDFELQETL